MIKFLVLVLFSISLLAIEHNSNISIKYINYHNYSNETILQGDTTLKLENDIFTTDITLEYLYSNEYKDRRYIMLNELYFTKEYEDYSFTFGKTIKYWGELEGFNIADIYNQKNYLLDPFNKSDKLGSIGLTLTKYFDENSLEVGVKLYEENIKYPSVNSPYYPFPINYDKELQLSNKRYTPTVYMTYNLLTDDNLDSDTKLILMHGYDNKRYFVPINQTTLSQYAYRVNKILLLSNMLYQDIIFKYEVSYTDVIDDEIMSDYAQLSFGIEKSFYDIANVDIGVYLEYYKYIYMQDGQIENVDISEIYNDDIFSALKINFNDVRDSEIKGGFLYDTNNQEKVFKLEAKSRIIDSFILNVEYFQIISSENTFLSNIGDSTRVFAGLTYTF